MIRFIIRRILEAIPTLLVLITISFFMMRLAPGSPFTGDRMLPPEVLANIEAQYNLNAPLYEQYFDYLKQLLHGDLGPSFRYRDHTVNELVATHFPTRDLCLYSRGNTWNISWRYRRLKAKQLLGLSCYGFCNDRCRGS